MSRQFTVVVAFLACFALASCTDTQSRNNSTQTAGELENTECFPPDLTISLDAATAEDASSAAKREDLRLPDLSMLAPLTVRAIGILGDGPHGIAIQFDTPGDEWPAARMQLTPTPDCYPPEGPVEATTQNGIIVTRQDRGSLVGYVASFELDGTFVEFSASWIDDAAPQEDGRLGTFLALLAKVSGS